MDPPFSFRTIKALLQIVSVPGEDFRLHKAIVAETHFVTFSINKPENIHFTQKILKSLKIIIIVTVEYISVLL